MNANYSLLNNDQPDEALENKLAEIETAEKEKIASQLAATSGLGYVNLHAFAISEGALRLIPAETAQNLRAICFLWLGQEIRLAAVNPSQPEIKQLAADIERDKHAHVKLYVVSDHSMDAALKMYSRLPQIREFIKGVKINASEIEKFKSKVKNFKDLDRELKQLSISDTISLVIATALDTKASDIHIEAEEGDIKVRLRLDGVLQDVASLDKNSWKQIISRVKLLAGLKINITEQPQDGRFTIFLTADKVDVRVSCLPTAYGESVVMRLLMSEATGLDFDKLGLRGAAFQKLEHEIRRPNGMIITTGPTGSGKTTTLYAIIKKLNQPQVKIVTLEDPIEYKLSGINQSQVNSDKSYSFANALKAVLRQDPNIIMVGEIRDLETAETAVNAALTGHLVISTLHTNSAAAALPRFLSLGVKPPLLTPALNAIIGQRLVRKLCPACRQEAAPTPENLARAREILSQIPLTSAEKLNLDQLKFYTAPGCPQCHGLGYAGRIGIYEILIMTPEIENLALNSQATENAILKLAQSAGMLTMVQDGLLKALEGITSLEEVFRVAE